VITLYKYIFCKAYNFCIRAFKEKEFPWAFASGMVTLCIVTSIVILLEVMEYMVLPYRINIYASYHGYLAVALWILIQIYITRKKKYLRILEECKNIPLKKQKILRSLSIAYLLLLFIGFFGLGYLIREYNINH